MLNNLGVGLGCHGALLGGRYFQCKGEAILGTTKRTANLQPLPTPNAPSSQFIQSGSGCCLCEIQ